MFIHSEVVETHVRSQSSDEEDDLDSSMMRVGRRLKTCRDCGEKFASSSRLVEHMRAHRDATEDNSAKRNIEANGPATSECKVCGYSALSKEGLERHYTLKHSEAQPKLTPLDCIEEITADPAFDDVAAATSVNTDVGRIKIIAREPTETEASEQEVSKSCVCHECGFVAKNVNGLRLHTLHKHKSQRKHCIKIVVQPPIESESHDVVEAPSEASPEQTTDEPTSPAPTKKVAKAYKHSCKLCDFKTNRQGLFIRHMWTHGSGESGQTASDVDNEIKSLKLVQQKLTRTVFDKPVKCFKCNFRSIKMRELRTHLLVHFRSGGPFQCDLCPRSYTSLFPFFEHLLHYHPQPDQTMHSCDKCDFTSASVFHYSRHIERSHMPEELRIKCDECGETYRDEHNLAVHKRRIHRGEKISFGAPAQCEVCLKTLSSNANLKIHMRTHTKEKPYKCNFCAKAFSQYVQLRTHRVQEHGTIESVQPKRRRVHRKALKENKIVIRSAFNQAVKMPCRYCGKSYKPPHIFDHEKLHEDPDAFKCSKCGKRYSSSAAMKFHQKSCLNPDGDTLRPCRFCGRMFARSYLYLHEKRHLMSKTNRPFKCEVCLREYSNEKGLQLHMKKHSEEPQLLCDICNKPCYTKTGLKKHQAMHKQRSCRLCTFVGSAGFELVRHMSDVHGENMTVSGKPTKLYKCDNCNYCTEYSSNMRKHTAKTQHTCAIQAARPFQPRYGKERPIVCHVCNFKTSRPHKLKDHMFSFHSDNLANFEAFLLVQLPEPIECNVCGVTLSDERDMLQHNLTCANKINRWKCPHCSFSSNAKVNLTEHLSTHTGKRRYRCHLCSFTTAYRSGINGHLRREHGTKFSMHRNDTDPLKESRKNRDLEENSVFDLKEEEVEYFEVDPTQLEFHEVPTHEIECDDVEPLIVVDPNNFVQLEGTEVAFEIEVDHEVELALEEIKRENVLHSESVMM